MLAASKGGIRFMKIDRYHGRIICFLIIFKKKKLFLIQGKLIALKYAGKHLIYNSTLVFRVGPRERFFDPPPLLSILYMNTLYLFRVRLS